MQETRYIISEASKKVDVEQHTLRYWEEELELPIPRNEMGHRYFREEDIELLKAVKILKKKGYQLKAIKILVPEILKKIHNSNLDHEEIDKMQQEWNDKYMDSITEDNDQSSLSVNNSEVEQDSQNIMIQKSVDNKMEKFKKIMHGLVLDALQDNNGILSETVSDEVTNRVIKEMDYLLRVKEEREEERYKQFDKTIREVQLSRAETAAARSKVLKKKKGLFQKQ